MSVIPNNVDWAATAAWIALALSICSPFITAKMNNKHQLKLRELDSEDKIYEKKISSIENFLSYVGTYIANPDISTLEECSKHFFQIYAYVPEPLWDILDYLYTCLVNDDFVNAKAAFRDTTRSLTEILKEARLKEP